jgi:hypothetical protein
MFEKVCLNRSQLVRKFNIKQFDFLTLVKCRLRRLQESMLEGGKRAGDTDLRERRLKRKKAAEKRLKVLGEALGHVDDEDGVLVKVYDDIQIELSEKNAALKRMKQRVKALNSEIRQTHPRRLTWDYCTVYLQGADPPPPLYV